MVATNNGNNGTNVEIVKIDPVAWARKNNKITLGNVCDLVPDPTLNIRFRAGTEVYGVKIEHDTLELEELLPKIIEGGGILEPILVSVREEMVNAKTVRTMVPLRGNRRTYCGQKLAEDKSVSVELRDNLTKATPMILLHGLTRAQEEELINDQTQKQFLRSEIVRHVFDMRRQGRTFAQISNQLWEQMHMFSRRSKDLSEIREITDPRLKQEKIQKWLRGTLDNYLIWGYNLGSWMQKQILLSEMLLDGILPKTAEQPHFKSTYNAQKRIGDLKKAKEMDGAKFSPLMLVEGTEFKKLADKFRKEDLGETTGEGGGTGGKKMMSKDEIQSLKDSVQSRAQASVLEMILGDTVPDRQIRDDNAAIAEAKAMLVEQWLPKLNPQTAAIVRFCLVNPDVTDFQKFLEANCVQNITANNATATQDVETGEFSLVK